jgi:hypothetical protein
MENANITKVELNRYCTAAICYEIEELKNLIEKRKTE